MGFASNFLNMITSSWGGNTGIMGGMGGKVVKSSVSSGHRRGAGFSAGNINGEKASENLDNL